MINLDCVLKKINGKEYLKSFPDEADTGKPETVKNVLLNSLAVYPVRQKREIFLVNKLANDILNADNVPFEPSEIERNFLETVVFEATYRQEGEKNEVRGVYFPYLISQVLKELGVKE